MYGVPHYTFRQNKKFQIYADLCPLELLEQAVPDVFPQLHVFHRGIGINGVARPPFQISRLPRRLRMSLCQRLQDGAVISKTSKTALVEGAQSPFDPWDYPASAPYEIEKAPYKRKHDDKEYPRHFIACVGGLICDTNDKDHSDKLEYGIYKRGAYLQPIEHRQNKRKLGHNADSCDYKPNRYRKSATLLAFQFHIS